MITKTKHMTNYTYFFYAKNDPNKEPITKINAASEEHAVIIFSKMKKLSIDDFLNLFEISK